MVNTNVVLHNQKVVIVSQKGARVDAPIKFGAARALIELAHYLVSIGKQVLLIGISDRRSGVVNGIQFIGVQNETALFDTLRSISPIDTLIGISRSDIFIGPTVKRALIYHHGPHPPMGDFAIEFIRNQKIQLVVVSRDSMELQQQYGIPKEQIHLVYNGYNSQSFKLSNDKTRAQHRLIFAGSGVSYKGLDIAVQAFALLRNFFLDVEFHIFANLHEWSDQKTKHLWPIDWLDEKGYPIWTKIEHELPGLKYFGTVEHEELANAFQKASLLIMPSRIKETFGIVSLEAQACGCIPVLLRRGGFPETMREGSTGYLYDNNTPEDLALFIRNLWTKKLPSDEQRFKAAEWVSQEFSWQKTGEQLVTIIDKIPQESQHFVQITNIFWKTAACGKAKIVMLHNGIESPLLRMIMKVPFQLLRRLYRKCRR
jgi:glycosyltransferase involved in cell wall biosynthesis